MMRWNIKDGEKVNKDIKVQYHLNTDDLNKKLTNWKYEIFK